MKIHELKCWPEQLDALRGGRKTHEVRINDRNYQERDCLHLRGWNPKTGKYTGVELLVQVTYITQSQTFGMPKNYIVMSVKPLAWDLDAYKGRAP